MKKRFFATSRTEVIDITKAWLAISIAFTLASFGLKLSAAFFTTLVISAITAGIGFLFHELAHKLVAQKYNCMAEFRAFDMMLVLMVAVSFLGFIFAAPGAVMIAGRVTTRENGKISLAGPLMNYVLAAIFFALIFLAPMLKNIWNIGFQINAWLGLFNLIPFWIFDGKKIFDWNKAVWGAMVLIGIMAVFVV